MATTLASPARTGSRTGILAVMFAGFVLSGIATTIIGPMLPIFIRRWGLDDAQAGIFPMLQFFAALVGTLASFGVVRYIMHIDWVILPGMLAATVIGSLAMMLFFGYAGIAAALRAKAAPMLRNE